MATKDTNGYFEYIRTVRSAKLKAREKGLLYFYASMHDWNANGPSFAGVETIAAWTGMSIASVNRAKRRLKQLGWVRDFRQDRYSKVFVWVTKGISDPDYEKEGFAKYHKYSTVTEVPSFDQSEGFALSDLTNTLEETLIDEIDSATSQGIDDEAA